MLIHQELDELPLFQLTDPGSLASIMNMVEQDLQAQWPTLQQSFPALAQLAGPYHAATFPSLSPLPLERWTSFALILLDRPYLPVLENTCLLTDMDSACCLKCLAVVDNELGHDCMPAHYLLCMTWRCYRFGRTQADIGYGREPVWKAQSPGDIHGITPADEVRRILQNYRDQARHLLKGQEDDASTIARLQGELKSSGILCGELKDRQTQLSTGFASFKQRAEKVESLLKAKLDDGKREVLQLCTELKQFKGALYDARKTINVHQMEITKQRNSVSSLRGRLDAVNQELTEFAMASTERSQKINEQADRIADLTDQNATLIVVIEKANATLVEQKSLHALHEVASDKLRQQMAEDAKKWEERVKETGERHAACKTQLIGRQNEVVDLQRQVSASRTAITRLEQDLRNKDQVLESQIRLQTAADDLNKLLSKKLGEAQSDAKNQVVDLQGQVSASRTAITQLEQDLKNKDQSLQSQIRLQTNADDLNKSLAKKLGETQSDAEWFETELKQERQARKADITKVAKVEKILKDIKGRATRLAEERRAQDTLDRERVQRMEEETRKGRESIGTLQKQMAERDDQISALEKAVKVAEKGVALEESQVWLRCIKPAIDTIRQACLLLPTKTEATNTREETLYEGFAKLVDLGALAITSTTIIAYHAVQTENHQLLQQLEVATPSNVNYLNSARVEAERKDDLEVARLCKRLASYSLVLPTLEGAVIGDLVDIVMNVLDRKRMNSQWDVIWNYLRYFEAMAEVAQRDRFDVLPPTCYDFLAQSLTTLQKIEDMLVLVDPPAEKVYCVWALSKTQHLKAKFVSNQPKIDQWCRQSHRQQTVMDMWQLL